MTPIDLSIIIVSYNTREMTLECLRSVFVETKDTPFEVIVVDNNSGDGSADAIAQRFSQVDLIRLKSNIGFAAANNLAVERVRGEYLLLLNPDTIVIHGAVDRLRAFSQTRPKAGIWGGRTVNGHREMDPRSVWRRQTLWSVFCRAVGLSSVFRRSCLFDTEAYGDWERNSVREVDIVSGCFLLIRRELWERLGGFDPAFFMYGEEADLCLRARRLGARPMFTPDATIVHYGGASENVRADKLVRLLGAKALLIRKHWSSPTAWLGVHMLKIWCLTRGLWHNSNSLTPQHTTKSFGWLECWRRRQEWSAIQKQVK